MVISKELTSRGEKLLSVKAVAELLSLSKRTVHRLVSSGKIVTPLKINGSVRFRHSDIEKWIELGCPDRATFELRNNRGE
jgi:excisionase family DNA binding protein